MSLVSGVGDGVTFSSGDGVGFGVGVGLRVSPGFNVTGISMSGSSVASGVAGSAANILRRLRIIPVRVHGLPMVAGLAHVDKIAFGNPA